MLAQLPEPALQRRRNHQDLADHRHRISSRISHKRIVRLRHLVRAGECRRLGLHVNAGHGLDYHNVKAIAAIEGVEELNIGHAIIARAVFTGLSNAVADMKRLMREARQSPQPD